VRKRDFEGGHDGVVPGAWDNGFGGRLEGVRSLSWGRCAKGEGCEDHHECAAFGLQKEFSSASDQGNLALESGY
jgi:hypothetical protein